MLLILHPRDHTGIRVVRLSDGLLERVIDGRQSLGTTAERLGCPWEGQLRIHLNADLTVDENYFTVESTCLTEIFTKHLDV